MGNKPNKKGKKGDEEERDETSKDPFELSESDLSYARKIYKDPRFLDADSTVQFYDRHSVKHGVTVLVVGEPKCGAHSVFRLLTGANRSSKFSDLGSNFDKDDRIFQNCHFDKKPFDVNVWKTEEKLDLEPAPNESAEEQIISSLASTNVLKKINRNKEWRFRSEKDAEACEMATILVFDLTKPESLKALESYFVGLYWFYAKLEAKNKQNKAGKLLFKPVVVLVGVKKDLTEERKLQKDHLDTFVAQYKVPYVEVDASDAHTLGQTRDEVLAVVAKEWWSAVNRIFGPTPVTS